MFPFYQGVQCQDLPDGTYRCGSCPDGYHGNGEKCYRMTCRQNSCFQGKQCCEKRNVTKSEIKHYNQDMDKIYLHMYILMYIIHDTKAISNYLPTYLEIMDIYIF